MSNFDLQTKGAINIENNLYTLATHASKNEKYKCPSCNDEVFIKNGHLKKVHYCHYKNEGCGFYNVSSNDIKFKDLHTHKYAQTLFKKFYDNNIKFNIHKKCNKCINVVEKIIQKKENYKCVLEYSYKYNGSNKKIDCAILDDKDKLVHIIEIYNTHKTDIKDRPPDFIELNADNIISKGDNIKYGVIILESCKDFICEECEDKRILDITNHNLILHKVKKECKPKECKPKEIKITIVNQITIINHNQPMRWNQIKKDELDFNNKKRIESFFLKNNDIYIKPQKSAIKI